MMAMIHTFYSVCILLHDIFTKRLTPNVVHLREKMIEGRLNACYKKLAVARVAGRLINKVTIRMSRIDLKRYFGFINQWWTTV